MTHEFPLVSLERRILSHSQQRLDEAAYASFALTLSRIPAIVLTGLFLSTQHITLACWTIALAVLVDIADGMVFNFSSYAQHKGLREDRRILDAISDRVFIATTLFFALSAIRFPVAVYWIVMAREILLSICCVYPYLNRKAVYTSNLPSKAASALIAVQFIVFAITGSIPIYLIGLFCLLSVVGLALYICRPKYA